MSPEDGEVLLPFWQSDHIFLGQNDPPKKWMVKYCTNNDTFSGSIDTRISTRPHLLLEGLGLVFGLVPERVVEEHSHGFHEIVPNPPTTFGWWFQVVF